MQAQATAEESTPAWLWWNRCSDEQLQINYVNNHTDRYSSLRQNQSFVLNEEMQNAYKILQGYRKKLEKEVQGSGDSTFGNEHNIFFFFLFFFFWALFK